MSKVNVAAIQCAFSDNMTENIDRITGFIEQAANQGANIILPPELLQGHYFLRRGKGEAFRRRFSCGCPSRGDKNFQSCERTRRCRARVYLRAPMIRTIITAWP